MDKILNPKQTFLYYIRYNIIYIYIQGVGTSKIFYIPIA